MQNIEMLFGKWSVPITVLSAFFGGSLWVTSLFQKVSSNTQSIDGARVEIEKIEDSLSYQSTRLSRMEGKIDIIIFTIRARKDVPEIKAIK